MKKELIKNIVKTFGFGTYLLGVYTANVDGCGNRLCYSYMVESCNLCITCHSWRECIDDFVQRKCTEYNANPSLELIIDLFKRYPIKGEEKFASIARALHNADDRIDTIGYETPYGDEINQVNPYFNNIKKVRESNFKTLSSCISYSKDQNYLDFVEDLCAALFKFRYTYK